MKKKILSRIGNFVFNCISEYNHSKSVPVNAEAQDIKPCGELSSVSMQKFISLYQINPDEITANHTFINPTIKKEFELFYSGFQFGRAYSGGGE